MTKNYQSKKTISTYYFKQLKLKITVIRLQELCKYIVSKTSIIFRWSVSYYDAKWYTKWMHYYNDIFHHSNTIVICVRFYFIIFYDNFLVIFKIFVLYQFPMEYTCVYFIYYNNISNYKIQIFIDSRLFY